ncbi:His-Xaa-Ser system radical SAM maturase HxsB [Spongiibacter tropicus]|uniref:His-Xaa-Ser system radical SAM maturase HxsB n=1 Tax=Spongiibacter tropicus TaxID=454602 RepID=UPI0035BE3A37
MTALPFNFERLPSGKLFLSNLAGFHAVTDASSFFSIIETGEVFQPEIQQRLEEKLFLAPAGQEAVSLAALSSGFSKRLLSEMQFRPAFMIVPTLRCDHECTYCQVSRASERAKGYDLDETAIPKIIDVIHKLGDPPYQLEIQGGEPLLRFDLIQKIYHQASKVLGADTFSMVIASSLSLLNEGMLEWAKKKHVQFSMSLDGTDRIHNQNRILPSHDSFARAKRAVALIHEQLGKDRVASVTTVTAQLLGNPRDLIEAHLELGLTDMFVRPISPYGFANKQDNHYHIDEYLCFYEALFDLVLEYNREGKPIVEHSAAIHLKRLNTVGFSAYADLKSPSGYLLNTVLFNYDGKIFGSDEARMLQRVVKDIDLSCGSIDAEPLSNLSLTHYLMASSFTHDQPGCAECAYQPFCGADPCQNISLFGEPVGNKAVSSFCQYHKGMFTFLVDRLYHDPESAEMLNRWTHA